MATLSSNDDLFQATLPNMLKEKNKRTKNGLTLIRVKGKNAMPEDITVSKKIVKLFTFLHFVTGLDFGFVKSKNVKINLCLRLFPLVQACCFSIVAVHIIVITDDIMVSIFHFMLLTKYVYSALILFCYRDKMTLHKFLTKLYKLDQTMGISISLETRLVITVMVGIIFELIYIVTYCQMFVIYFINIIDYSLHIISTFIPTVMYFGYHNVVLRLKHVEHKILNEDNVDIMFYQWIYKSLADLLESFNETMYWMYAGLLLFFVPNMLVTIYHTTFMTLQDTNLAIMLQMGVYLSIEAITTFAPGFAAGMLTTEAEKINLALHNRLLSEQPYISECFKTDIESFIMYTKIRPFKYCVLKVVPLGWSLPVVVINVIITYTIVILQFSHIV